MEYIRRKGEFKLITPTVTFLGPPFWQDYELIDAGDGRKLERFGAYRLVRPETQAIWKPALPKDEWDRADAVFQRTRGDDSSGQWTQSCPLPERWALHHDNLTLWVRLTPFRHTGVFPEHSAHWQWMRERLLSVSDQAHVLVLFGYTGLSTLFAARLGARVCHVDASKPAMRWARENQESSRLQDCPIRWIVDDVSKFVDRELRRGTRYDMIVMDPPIFGRGPKGEIWRLHEGLPSLVERCVQLLSSKPAGLLINAYATNLSPLALHNVASTALQGHQGRVSSGELVLVDTTVARLLPTALYARWPEE
jgi:23S rRNA (cytosine1962-C5)-methyltransferase